MHEALAKGNEWARDASMIIVVFSKKEYDCLIREREYYLFDTGMATAFLILRATELGLVAHPIAGYKPAMVKEILGIPEEMMGIALVIVGRHARTISPVLSEEQVESEKERPKRKPLEEFIHHNVYHPEQEESGK
jgi:nitroreductase